MADESRVEYVANVIAERHKKGEPITQEATLNALMMRDGESCSNTTYQRALALFKHRQKHPLLQNEDLLLAVGEAAMASALKYIPDVAAFEELGQMAVNERERRELLESELADLATQIPSISKDLTGLRDFLKSKGANNGALAINNALALIGRFSALAEKQNSPV